MATREERRERGDLIKICNMISEAEEMGNMNLLLTEDVDTREMRHNNRKLREERYLNVKYRFPQRRGNTRDR